CLRRGAPLALGRRPRFQGGIGGAEQPAVLRVERELLHRAAFFAIDQDGRDLLGMLVELLGPLPERDHDREYAASFRRRHIFLIDTAIGGGRHFQNALVDQRAQPRREDVLRQSQALLEFAEAAAAEQG